MMIWDIYIHVYVYVYADYIPPLSWNMTLSSRCLGILTIYPPVISGSYGQSPFLIDESSNYI